MKICPKCRANRLRYSRTRTLFENFMCTRLGFRFYRCQVCNWRGMRQSTKTPSQFTGKKSIWFTLGIYALAIVLILILVFVVIGVGSDAPPPMQ